MSRFPSSSPAAQISLCVVLAIGAWPDGAHAQLQVAASAFIRVPAVFEGRHVSSSSARAVAVRRVEVVQEITTASNIDYLMTVVARADLSRLEREGLRVSVQTPTGDFVPLRPGIPVAGAKGQRGSGSITSVIVRVD